MGEQASAIDIDNDSTSVKFSFRNMNGADPPRWSQSHSESRLPHIITGLEDKHEVSLPVLPFIAFCFYELSSQTPKLKLFDKIKGLIAPKKQSQVHEPQAVLPSVPVAKLTESAQVCPLASSYHR